MSAQRILFFIRYYIKKHLLRTVSAGDIFSKRLYRLQDVLRGTTTHSGGEEILYNISAVNNRPVSVFIRGGRSSDIQVVHQVFAVSEYRPLVETIFRMNQQDYIRHIIDAGANVGYTTIFLKSFFPAAAVTLIEPDAGNLAQVQKNLAKNQLADCRVIAGGLWPKDSWLELKNNRNDASEWGFMVTESDHPTALRGYSFETILAETGYDTIDILKIDIEGSEKLLFEDESAISDVLRRTRFLAIEIHDETGARAMIYEVLRKNEFTWFEQGELTIATNTVLQKNLNQPA